MRHRFYLYPTRVWRGRWGRRGCTEKDTRKEPDLMRQNGPGGTVGFGMCVWSMSESF